MTTSFNPQNPSRQIINSQHAEKMLRNKKWDTSVCIQRSPIKTDQLTGSFQNEPPCDDVLHILTFFFWNSTEIAFFEKILKNWKFWKLLIFPLKINLNQLFEHPNEFENFREHSEPETIIFNRIIFKQIVMRSKNLNF